MSVKVPPLGTDHLPNVHKIETKLSHQGTSYYGNYAEAKSYTADPFRCRLEILTTKVETNFLKNLLSPLLEGIDPTFQFINLQEHGGESLGNWGQTTPNEEEHIYEDGGLECPALSVVLFLSETFGRLSAISVQKYLTSEPWKFHHRIELPKDVRPQVTAKQDFYQAFQDLPLWSISPVHYGNEHLRFHIVVRDFTRMRAFYEKIIEAKPRGSSAGFCYFPIYSQTGIDIQLSLKCLPQVYPRHTTAARLRFRIPNLHNVLPYLVNSPLPMPNKKGSWLTNDPDGNVIILEETAPMDQEPEGHDTSDYETGSAETDSNASSKGSLNEALKFTDHVRDLKPDFV